MTLKKLLFGAILLASGNLAIAQNSDSNPLTLDPSLAKQWLVALEGDTVTAGDFWYVFNKNNFKKEVPTKASLEDYKDLFTKFKLKVKDAEMNGLDTTPKFLKEFEGYKNQLAESYLKDKSVTDDLVKEAFERSQIDIDASHILIMSRTHDLPQDTLAAYKKALMIKQKAEAGEDFETLAKTYSEDPSVQQNGGRLGYFTAFKMVYPFESAAYNTKEGGISEIVRTRFGYHIIKVHDRRNAVGEVKVAHIMAVVKPEMTQEQKDKAKAKIEEVLKKLNAGEDFTTLAMKYSEHAASSRMGGELPWFGTNKYAIEFENAAFSIEKNGDVIGPVETPYGWHIIKLINKKPLESFESLETSLKSKVSRSDRAELSKEVVIKRIKKEYNFKENAKSLAYFYEICDSSLVEGKWKIPAKAKLKKEMFSFAGKSYKQKAFADYLVSKMVARKGGEYQPLVNFMYQEWVEGIITDYEKTQLSRKYPEYNRLLKEYRDGIILFELTDVKVWSKAVKDSTGLKEYHSANAQKWMWSERMEGTVYICSDEATAIGTKKLLDAGKGDIVILEKMNQNSLLKVRVEEGVYEVDGRPEISAFEVKQGISEIKKVGENYIVLKVNKIIPPSPKELKEIKGLVTAAYQDHLMNQWLTELSNKYKVVYNEEVFKKLIP